jgi:hypothetical protein
MPLIFDQLGRHFLDRHNVIDETGSRGAVRHPAHGGVIELGLRQGQATTLLDFGQA